jgi:mRNA-degrading endonuclease HigB of HigAB toxin-antitoxin module
MHIISRKALRTFWEKHPDSESSLRRWFTAMNTLSFRSFQELRTVYVRHILTHKAYDKGAWKHERDH